MVPKTIRKQLARLRRRERVLRLVWGSARWFALAFVVLALACLADWLIDRATETPWALRWTMSLGQAALWTVAAFVLVLRPLARRLSDSKLALWVEAKTPHLGHRLISTVQFNQPGAKTAGMSQELIAAVTQETEKLTPQVHFPAVADHRRLKWSAAVAGPVLLAGVLPFLLIPGLTTTLLARQLLQDREIPRSIYLHADTAAVWPSGEEVVLRFRVRGDALASDLKGEARVYPEYGPRESFELAYEGPAGPGEAFFTARVRPLSVNFAFRAYLLDGRTPRDGHVRFEPRPAFTQDAWLLLPEYCGLRPDGTPYEVPQARGEIVGPRGLKARVVAMIQKPVKEAVLELLGTPYADLSRPGRDAFVQQNAALALAGATLTALGGTPAVAGSLEETLRLVASRCEVVLERKRQSFPKGVTEVNWTLALRPTETAYRIQVFDEYGFANVPAPPRGIAIVPERPPQVALLRERFEPIKAFRGKGQDDDDEVDGMPVPPSGPIRIAYTASGPYGLGAARLRYRVVKKVEGSPQEAPPGEEKYALLFLDEWKGTPKGKFEERRGVFDDTGDKEEIPFYALPSPNPNFVLPRTKAGGRFDFKISNLLDDKGERIVLRPGDQIEFYVEVLNRNPDRSEAVVGRSETRVKLIVSGTEFLAWMRNTVQEEERIRGLEARQRGVDPDRQDRPDSE